MDMDQVAPLRSPERGPLMSAKTTAVIVSAILGALFIYTMPMYMASRGEVFGKRPGSTCMVLDVKPQNATLSECWARWQIYFRRGFEGELTRPLGWTDAICPCDRSIYFPPFPVMKDVQVWPGIHGSPYGQKLWRAFHDRYDADARAHPHAVVFADGSRVPPEAIGGDTKPNEFFAAETEGLHLRFGKEEWGDDADTKETAHAKGLRALQQQWGGGDGSVNQGCVWQNVYVDPDTGYLVTECHGDLYEGPVVGIMKDVDNPTLSTDSDPPFSANTCADDPCKVVGCGKYRTATGLKFKKGGPGARVGGVACTRKFYGPGRYEVVTHIPPSDAPATTYTDRDDKKVHQPAGRGYVWAAWTFSYFESYAQGRPAEPRKGLPALERDPQYVSGGKLGHADSEFPGFNPLRDDDPDKQYTVRNDEIDIEIPANFPTVGGEEALGKRFGWNTINLNSWVSDNEKYGELDENGQQTSWYRQIAAEIDPKTKKDFIAKKPAPGEKPQFRNYWFDWIVPKDGSPPYIDFWVDHEFLYRETCFVPSRSSRFNCGPWFAWWGFNGVRGQPHTYTANFDTVKCLIKEIRITPDPNSKVTDYPQTFNQASPFMDDEDGRQDMCDIRTLDGEIDRTPPRPSRAS